MLPPSPAARLICCLSAFLARFALCFKARRFSGWLVDKKPGAELLLRTRVALAVLKRSLGGGSERPFAAVEGVVVATVVGGEVADGAGEGERDLFRGILDVKSSDSISTLKEKRCHCTRSTILKRKIKFDTETHTC